MRVAAKMLKSRILPSLVIALCLGTPLVAEADSADYSDHVRALEEVASHFPGPVASVGFQHRSLGLWGGNMVQTLWQEKSGRSEILLWSEVNRSLTIEPRDYALSYLRGEHCLGDDTVCQAWYRYFKSTRIWATGSMRQQLFWRAHTSAIHRTLTKMEREFEQADVPRLERTYWRNWISLVDTFEKRRISSQDWAVYPLARKLSPPCAPLGSQGCDLRDLGPRQRRFVEIMTSPTFDPVRDFARIAALALSRR